MGDLTAGDVPADDVPADDVPARVRAICMALPEVVERSSHGCEDAYRCVAPRRLVARLDR